MVAVKTFVFSIDEGLDDNGRDILVLDRRTVFAEKTTDKYTVGTVYLGASLVTGCSMSLNPGDFPNR